MTGTSNGDQREGDAILHKGGTSGCLGDAVVAVARPALGATCVEAVDELQPQFTGPIARGLSLIAIVIGGLMSAFGEGGSKRTLAGIIFGLGMAMGAAKFLAWLF